MRLGMVTQGLWPNEHVIILVQQHLVAEAFLYIPYGRVWTWARVRSVRGDELRHWLQ